MTSNPLLDAFVNEGHGWARGLVAVLQDHERRLQLLGSDPQEKSGDGGNEHEESGADDSESATGSVQE